MKSLNTVSCALKGISKARSGSFAQLFRRQRQEDHEFEISKTPSQNKKISQAPVAHACNPSYSGGRDQEDHSSKPTMRK
jgi:hypothetical protein